MDDEAVERRGHKVSPQNAEPTIEPADDELWFGVPSILLDATCAFFVAWVLERARHGEKTVVPWVVGLLFAINDGWLAVHSRVQVVAAPQRALDGSPSPMLRWAYRREGDRARAPPGSGHSFEEECHPRPPPHAQRGDAERAVRGLCQRRLKTDPGASAEF